MDELRNVEYLPEPNDRSIVSAIDPAVVGHQDGYRSQVTGWAPRIAMPMVRHRRRFPVGNAVALAVLISVGMFLWQSQLLVIQLPLPDSEWAYDATNIREMQEDGLTGDGIRVCMVDTGLDPEHEAFAGSDIVFHDLVGNSATPKEYGAIAHGTLMAGILVADAHQLGAAPNVTLGMVAALSDDGMGENTGDESVVGDAIRWCQFQFQADIISLSLGGAPSMSMDREGNSASATRQATDSGIYVIAAAGNDGGVDDDGDVSSPGNVPRAISVGAVTKDGTVWENSSRGSQTLANGDQRQSPHLKPEVVAPGHQIISTGQSGTWYSSSGTSDSTVFVTGALSLILEANPHLRASVQENGNCIDAVKQALADSSQPLLDGKVHDDRWGYGSLDTIAWAEEVGKITSCG